MLLLVTNHLTGGGGDFLLLWVVMEEFEKGEKYNYII